jgi:hypothetical protein
MQSKVNYQFSTEEYLYEVNICRPLVPVWGKAARLLASVLTPGAPLAPTFGLQCHSFISFLLSSIKLPGSTCSADTAACQRFRQDSERPAVNLGKVCTRMGLPSASFFASFSSQHVTSHPHPNTLCSVRNSRRHHSGTRKIGTFSLRTSTALPRVMETWSARPALISTAPRRPRR